MGVLKDGAVGITAAAEENIGFDRVRSLKKTAPGLMSKLKYVDLWLNRPLAMLLVKMVYNTRITPNQITLFSCLLGLLSAVLFSFGKAETFIAGGILLQIASIIDGADGMLARSRNQCSRFGASLDILCDRLVDFSAIAGLALGAYRFGFSLQVMVLGLIAAGLYGLQVCFFYIIKVYLRTEKSGDSGEARAIAIWIILLATVTLHVDWLLIAMLAVSSLINIYHLILFFRVSRTVQ